MTTYKNISLGLQGGGTYGAFGWGVLDRLLQEEWLRIDALSGTSAGAINAVVLADGYAHGGGRKGARRALDRFWRTLGQAALLTPLQRTPLDHLAGGYTIEHSPMYQMLEMAGALAGPVFETPVTLNPLRNLLTALVDFTRVRECEELELFLTATNVRTGTGKVFTRRELDAQKVLASACLPTVFAAVEVEGETYWDGSYVANPPLVPLIEHAGARDLVIVQNNPIARQDVPRSMADISNRANEIAFNISFMREIGALQHLHGAPDEERSAYATADPVRLHLISGNHHLSEFKISAKFNPEMGFLQRLHDLGVATAQAWLDEHAHALGVRSTLDPTPVYFADRE